ncbi:hypothetical protein ZEAMMB73_Zm00001d039334 [Zea mays]|uniref:Uncharacterized protein n=1 Tax=Zea mays TaxID=4577 RepID=A0A1D6MFD4_MAIZE|nr:hypothetical protein ZEAMMB73_Zm00001d039334 [Zea mays]
MDTSLVQQWPLLTSALAWVCMTREMSPPSSFPRAWIEGSSSLSVFALQTWICMLLPPKRRETLIWIIGFMHK